MKLIKTALASSVLAIASLTPAFAQSSTMKVTVPFAFVVGDQKFSAGEYDVRTSDYNGLVFIQGSGQSAAVLSSPLGAYEPDAKPNLVFKNSDEGERLVRVQMEGSPSRQVSFRNNAKLLVAR